MKNALLAAGGFVIILLLWFWLRPEPVITNHPSSGSEIIAFGDSLVEGVGATAGNDLVSRLEVATGEPIINLGVSGDTTADALARIDEVTSRDPKVVILLVGGNDAIQNVPLATTQQNLSTIITEIHQAGAVVLLLGVRGGLLSSGGFDEMYEYLAKEHGTAFVPDIFSGVFGRSSLMADPIHPNDAGYEKIAERVVPVLEKLID